MAINSEKVEVATCNACGKRQYSVEHIFDGVAGQASVTTSDGLGFTVSWYSCSHAPGHIGRAVREAINAGPEHDQDTL